MYYTLNTSHAIVYLGFVRLLILEKWSKTIIIIV